MMNVLFLVYEFPPLNSGGSHRPFRFSKYLQQFGINPVIITPEVSDEKYDNTWFKADFVRAFDSSNKNLQGLEHRLVNL